MLFGTPECEPELVTLYAGSLDDPKVFNPQAALFTGQRPAWAQLSVELIEHTTLPGK